jgi:hypothetical protein
MLGDHVLHLWPHRGCTLTYIYLGDFVRVGNLKDIVASARSMM